MVVDFPLPIGAWLEFPSLNIIFELSCLVSIQVVCFDRFAFLVGHFESNFISYLMLYSVESSENNRGMH